MSPHSHLWVAPPPAPRAQRDQVHVWRAFLDATDAQVDVLHDALAADEQARAARFCFPRDRSRFIVARGLLRTILARYLHVPPEQLRFTLGLQGKPALGHVAGRSSQIRFNVSHCANLALYAISSAREIGIDVEQLRTGFPVEAVAGQFFSAREHDALLVLPPEKRCEAFFTCWTSKEAYLKARGDGLGSSLSCFDVALDPRAPPGLLRSQLGAHEVARWRFQRVHPAADHSGTLVVEGHDWQLRCWSWP